LVLKTPRGLSRLPQRYIIVRMVREYKWRLRVRSYEGDAWGLVPTSGILRYLEQSAVIAAANLGYGAEYHREHNSAWVIRRMSLVMHTPVRQGDELEIATWITHFAKVRGGREYVVSNAASGQALYSGLAEWVYVDRQTLAPKAIPPGLDAVFDTPGAPIYRYDAPQVEVSAEQPRFTTERTVEWHELDSMGHVNNAMYADWLDDAFKAAMDVMGWNVARLKEEGLHLRGEHHSLNYKRAAMPGDKLFVTTIIGGATGRLCSVSQAVTDTNGEELMSADSVYGWRDNAGQPCEAPHGFAANIT
jgi:acyl-CoA thioester hydrolase